MKHSKIHTNLPDDYFPDEWYELATDQHFWIRARYHFFWQQLQKLPIAFNTPLHGLEIGCGNGVVRHQLEQHTTWVIDGVDLNKDILQHPHYGKGQTFFYNIHDRRPDLEEKYDLIILFDVLEHIHETEQFLDSTRYHLKHEGWLFINVPALPLLISRYDIVANHHRRYTAKMLHTALQYASFQIEDMRYWGITMIPLVILRKLLISKYAPRSKVIKRGFKPPNALLNTLLWKILVFENMLTKQPVLGTSLLGAARKT